MGMRERRTQEARIAALFARPRTYYRAAKCFPAAGVSLFSSLLEQIVAHVVARRKLPVLLRIERQELALPLRVERFDLHDKAAGPGGALLFQRFGEGRPQSRRSADAKHTSLGVYQLEDPGPFGHPRERRGADLFTFERRQNRLTKTALITAPGKPACASLADSSQGARRADDHALSTERAARLS